MTDTLSTTSTTAFMHDHGPYSRGDKTERIAKSEYALSRPKVCYSSTPACADRDAARR
jgi:hypothetical protein